MDFGQFEGDYYLVMVDAYSKWPEVVLMPGSTTAQKTADAMRSIFARLGLCEEIVADNGPPFPSSELQAFLKSNGIKTIFSSPYHPASNGAAERFVKTLKRGLRKSSSKSSKLHRLHEFLLTYRSTPHSVTGQPPSELLWGRRIRTRLDLVRPDLRGRMAKRGEGVLHPKVFHIGDQVIARDYRNVRKPGWRPGVVIATLSPVTYQVQVELSSGTVIWKRHLDQLRPRESGEDSSGRDKGCAEEDPAGGRGLGFPIVGTGDTEISQETTEGDSSDNPEDRGGRAPTELPCPESAVAGAAARTAMVGSDDTSNEVPAATQMRPTRQRRPPAYLKDYERY